MIKTSNKVRYWIDRIVQPPVVEIEGIKISVPAIASEVIRKAIYKRTYEASELCLIKERLSQDDVVMEIGTGLGLLSTYCAKQIGGDRVFTFEANPALESAIRENYRLNQVAPKLEMGLVGDRSGSETFYIGDNFWSSSIFNKPQGAKPITLPVISFNEKVKEISPSFLLLDIEGGEYEFVKYADFHTIRKLMIELHSWVLSTEQQQFVRDRLAQENFQLVSGKDGGELYFER